MNIYSSYYRGKDYLEGLDLLKLALYCRPVKITICYIFHTYKCNDLF